MLCGSVQSWLLGVMEVTSALGGISVRTESAEERRRRHRLFSHAHRFAPPMVRRPIRTQDGVRLLLRATCPRIGQSERSSGAMAIAIGKTRRSILGGFKIVV